MVHFEDDASGITRYQPAFAIARLSVGLVLQRIDEHGSENFPIDTSGTYRNQWEALLRTRRDLLAAGEGVLLKDL